MTGTRKRFFLHLKSVWLFHSKHLKTVLEQGFSLKNFPSQNVWKLYEAETKGISKNISGPLDSPAGVKKLHWVAECWIKIMTTAFRDVFRTLWKIQDETFC